MGEGRLLWLQQPAMGSGLHRYLWIYSAQLPCLLLRSAFCWVNHLLTLWVVSPSGRDSLNAGAGTGSKQREGAGCGTNAPFLMTLCYKLSPLCPVELHSFISVRLQLCLSLMNCWDDNNKLSKYTLIVHVEGKREQWGGGKDLSLALFFLCVAVSIWWMWCFTLWIW